MNEHLKEEIKMEKKKLVSIEDRIPKLKEARKKKANRRLIFYLSIFFFLISAIVYLQSPLSYIKHIEVTGNQVISEQEVIERSGLSTDTNIWVMNQANIQEKIETQPLIEAVEVKRKLPQTIELNVTEHQVIGFVKDDSEYHPVLKDGMIITTLNIPYTGDGPLLHHFDDEQYLQRIANELSQIPEHVYQLISEITWDPTDKNKYKIILYMNDGFIVHATLRDFASKMATYPSIVAQLEPDEKGIIHMGVGTYFEKIEN